MNIASGSRVPGGALPRSTRLASLTTASMAKSISASLASHTAPGLRSHSAKPAATPTLVMMSRAARTTIDSVYRYSMFDTIDAARSASVAGFQTVRMKMSGSIQSGILGRPTDARPYATAGSISSGDLAFRLTSRRRAPSM
jgi:hypothetical protein